MSLDKTYHPYEGVNNHRPDTQRRNAENFIEGAKNAGVDATLKPDHIKYQCEFPIVQFMAKLQALETEKDKELLEWANAMVPGN